MELSNIQDAFDLVAKTQKLSSSKSQEVVDQVRCDIEQALATIQSRHDPSTPVAQKSILTELKSKLNAIIGELQHLEESHKKLNTSIVKYQKLVENLLNIDISKAYGDAGFDSHIINQIIASHFYHQCLFELGDSIMNKAGEPDAMTIKFQAMKLEIDQIIQAMKDRNLKPALTWVAANHEKLTQIGSNLEFEIHKLQFVEILQKGTYKDAINYVKTDLAPFKLTNMDEMHKLMVGFLFAESLENSPYPELISPHLWESTTEELARQLHTLMT